MNSNTQRNRRLAAILLLLAMFASAPAGILSPVMAQSEIGTRESIPVQIIPAKPPYANVLLDMAPVKTPVKPYVEEGITMVPLRALGEALGAGIGWDNDARAATYSKDNITLVVRIGEPAVETSDGRVIAMPQTASLLEGNTMVPLRLFSEILGYQVVWDDITRTVHILSPRESMELWGFYTLGSADYSSWQDAFASKYPFTAHQSPADDMGGLFLGWFAIDKDGRVACAPNPTGFQKPDGWPAVLLQARLKGLKVFSMYFADQSTSNISELLEDPVARDSLAQDIALTAREYDGVLIDFEGLGLDTSKANLDKENYNEFLNTLKDYLSGKPLSVAVPPLNSSFTGYDHEHIGNIADFIVLMAYAYEDPFTPSATAPFEKVESAIKLEIKAVGPEKIILGIPAYGTMYKTTSEGACLKAYPASKDGLSMLSEYRNHIDMEPNTGPPCVNPVFAPEYLSIYVEWESHGDSYKAFLEGPASLQTRLLMAKRFGITRAAIWRLGLLHEDWWASANRVMNIRRHEEQ